MHSSGLSPYIYSMPLRSELHPFLINSLLPMRDGSFLFHVGCFTCPVARQAAKPDKCISSEWTYRRKVLMNHCDSASAGAGPEAGRTWEIVPKIQLVSLINCDHVLVAGFSVPEGSLSRTEAMYLT